MSFGSDSPGGSPEGIGGNESGIGGGSQGGGGGGGSYGNQGGFGGLGIGNPGSYGGQQSVGAPGFGGEMGGSNGGFSDAAISVAMHQSLAQEAQNNIERGLAGLDFGSQRIGSMTQDINQLSPERQAGFSEALDRRNMAKSMREGGWMDAINRYNTMRKVGGSMDGVTAGMGEKAVSSILGTAGTKALKGAASAFGPLGALFGGRLAEATMNKALSWGQKRGDMDYLDQVLETGDTSPLSSTQGHFAGQGMQGRNPLLPVPPEQAQEATLQDLIARMNQPSNIARRG